MARLGVYNLRIHAENVIDPLIKHWKVADRIVTTGEARQAQDELMALVPDLVERAEQFERRQDRRARAKEPVAVAGA